MHLPASRPDPTDIQVTDSSRFDDFAALARVLRGQQGSMTVVYAPSTITITNAAPAVTPALVEVRVPTPAGPVAEVSTQTARICPRYTVGEVIACSGLTLAGGGILSVLVTALLQVPELVPVLGGSTGLVGMLAAMVGFALDQHERDGGMR
jgi:hypothetical protein